MLNQVSVRGRAGAILWGYRTAAQLTTWRIYHHKPDGKHDDRWVLTATLSRVDKFQLRQRPLMFSGAREGLKGYWCWPLLSATIDANDTQLTAQLGPPQQ